MTTQKKPRSIVSLIWNWSGVIVDVATSLILTPLLIDSLGDVNYSLWILIGSFTSSFGMLDLGMRGAVGRYVAYYHAKGDSKAISCVLSTAAVALVCAGMVSLVCSVCVSWIFPWAYGIPESQVGPVRCATLVVGIQLAFFFIGRMFDAALWGYQRFDLLNMIDIPTTLGRGVLISLFVLGGGGIVALSLISLFTVVVNGVIKCWFTYRLSPDLRIGVKEPTAAMLRTLVGYGFWSFVISLGTTVRSQFTPLVVGNVVGVSAVAPFSIIMRLPAMAALIINASTGVFAPVAVANHAQQDAVRKQRMLIKGTQLGLSFALYFLALFCWLGKPLLTIWIRPEFGEYWPLLLVIAMGETLPMSMSVALSMILAAASHKRVAWLTIIESLFGLSLTIVCGHLFGLIGIVTALAITGTVFRGVYVFWYACEMTSEKKSECALKMVCSPLLVAMAPCLLLYGIVEAFPPNNWGLLFLHAGTFTAVYGFMVLLFLLEGIRSRNLLVSS